MAGRTFLFDPPDRFVAGAVGQPGQRSFFLQATKGSAVLSVAVEKVQVALLAARIGELVETLDRPETATVSASLRPGIGDATDLQQPVIEAFRIGSLSLTYDDERSDLTLEAREVPAPDDDEGPEVVPASDPGDVLRVRLSLAQARVFAERALHVVAAGRPPCPICGEPLDPQGHICLRRNGYVM